MQKLNLVLHAGGAAVEREQLDLVHTPPADDTWFPIPHALLLETVQSQLGGLGLKVVSEAHALARDGQRYFGLLQVVNGKEDNDYGLVLGLRNSHDKSFPAALAVGSSVFVCDNLAFSGEIKIGRKHTRHIERDLPGLTATALGRLGALRVRQDQRIAAYKTSELSDSDADHIILTAFRSRALNVQRIPDVVREWFEPRHPEFAKDGKTAWRLFNAFTEAYKGRLDTLPGNTQKLHAILDGHCHVVEEEVVAEELVG